MTNSDHIKKENKELKIQIKSLEEELKAKDFIEKRLKENEGFYKYLFGQISIPYESLNPEGEIIEVNQAWLDLMNVKNKKDVIGKSITNFIHPDSISVLQENFPRFLKNGFVRDVEFHLVKSTGEDFYIKNNGIINYKPDGNPRQTYCLFHDITETKRKEELLYNELELSKKLINSTPNIIYIYDISLNKNITINDRVTQILDYSKEEIDKFSNSILKQIMHPDDFKNYLENIVPAYANLAKDEFVEHTYRMKKKNGDYIWLLSKESVFKYDEKGIPIQIFGIAEDVTEKILTEQKLVEQMNDLMRSNKLMVWREHKMIGLKQEINTLRQELGKNKKYSAPDKSKLFRNDLI